MGWFGYNLYDGDETQTRHLEFMKIAGIVKDDDEGFSCFRMRKTKIPKEKVNLLISNYSKIEKLMSKKKFLNEDDALAWQMFASLYLDNNVKLPSRLKEKAISATEYLIQEQCDDFDKPYLRRRVLNNFLNKVNKNE